MNRTAREWSVVVAAGLVLVACGDPMKKPELIEETRVIGARVEVDGDPERAWPRPGETATARWLVAHPGPPVPVSWAFAVCPAADVAFGVPSCVTSPFATARQDNPGTGEPSITFQVPEEAADWGVSEVVVLGVVCTAGMPVLTDELETSECEEGEGHRVFFTVGLELDVESNHNPSLASAPFMLDDAAWESDAEPASCAEAAAAVSVPVGSEHVIDFDLTDCDREALETEYDVDEAVEAIQISQFATGGDLERAYSVVEGDQPNRVELTWTAPKEAPAAGKLVRFYFVARDPRGGADWTTRFVCVTR